MFLKEASGTSYQAVCYYTEGDDKREWRHAPSRSTDTVWAKCSNWIAKQPPELGWEDLTACIEWTITTRMKVTKEVPTSPCESPRTPSRTRSRSSHAMPGRSEERQTSPESTDGRRNAAESALKEIEEEDRCRTRSRSQPPGRSRNKGRRIAQNSEADNRREKSATTSNSSDVESEALLDEAKGKKGRADPQVEETSGDETNTKQRRGMKGLSTLLAAGDDSNQEHDPVYSLFRDAAEVTEWPKVIVSKGGSHKLIDAEIERGGWWLRLQHPEDQTQDVSPDQLKKVISALRRKKGFTFHSIGESRQTKTVQINIGPPRQKGSKSKSQGTVHWYPSRQGEAGGNARISTSAKEKAVSLRKGLLASKWFEDASGAGGSESGGVGFQSNGGMLLPPIEYNHYSSNRKIEQILKIAIDRVGEDGAHLLEKYLITTGADENESKKMIDKMLADHKKKTTSSRQGNLKKDKKKVK